MAAKPLLAVFAAALLLWPGCGRKGELLPPLAPIPQPPTGLRAVQRGGSAVLTWVNPVASVDGRPLAGLAAAEVWILEGPKPAPGTAAAAVSARELERAGTLAATLKPAAPAEPAGEAAVLPSGCSLPLKAPTLGLTVLHVGVRVRDSRGRPSEFAPTALVEPLALSLPPREVTAQLFADRIEITWLPPEANIDGSRPARLAGYLVDRIAGEEPPVRLTAAPVDKRVYEDRDFEMGRTYRYVVRAAAGTAAPYAESDAAAPVVVAAKDVFAPAVPAGLLAVAGPGFVSLSWEAGLEPDLRGYNVWRRAEGEAELRLLTAAPILENAFTDTAVEKGRKYSYSVSARDAAGNESARCAPVAATAGDGR